MAGIHIGKAFRQTKNNQKLSEYIMQQQNETLAHVIRTDRQDLMRRMNLSEHLEILGVHTRRVGRPRQPWVASHSYWIYQQEHQGIEYSRDNFAHNTWVKTRTLRLTDNSSCTFLFVLRNGRIETCP